MVAERMAWVLGVVLLVGCGGEDSTPAPPPPAEEETPEQLAVIEGVDVFEDLNPDPDVLEIELIAGYAQAEIELGAVTDVMAFNGSVPGPLLYGREGDRVIVHFVNQLSEPTMVHFHGLRISAQMNGGPGLMDPVPPGGTFTYEFVLPDAGTYWYHPAIDSIEQLDRGLYGPIVVAEAEAPEFSSERLLMIDDVRLGDDKQMEPFTNAHHDMMHGRGGDQLLTNGKTYPVTGTIEDGAIERWRIANTANATTLEISIDNAAWRVIGSDGGLLPEPYTTERLVLPSGQRYDVEIRVAAEQGSVVRLRSHVIPGVDSETDATQPLAEFVVTGEVEASEPSYPAVTLPAIVEASEQAITLDAYLDANEAVVWAINGMPGAEVPDLSLQQGVPVRLKIDNAVGFYFPFHIEGQFFQVLTRNGVPAAEPGLKDTVLINGLETVELLSYFENPGVWAYHSHIPAYVEQGQLARVVVTPSE
jgi:FtsP/CotA-like multicopper oxidase with cupredoxin domain